MISCSSNDHARRPTLDPREPISKQNNLSNLSHNKNPKAESSTDSEILEEVLHLCERAVVASRILARSSAAQRSAGLHYIAESIEKAAAPILLANAKDLLHAQDSGLPNALIDRLTLDDTRLHSLWSAVREIADQEDLIGKVEGENRRPNGLLVSRVRIPLGVIAMIFESRPNVTSDAAALCLRSCNAVILRGGKEALHSSQALGRAIREGLVNAGLPADVVQIVGTTDRRAMRALLQRENMVDLVIPRGGEGLIRFVSEHSRIPVIKHYKGVCHVYVHRDANLKMACAIATNAKASRPGVCNSAETILVDRDVAEKFVPMICGALAALGVEIRGDEETRRLAKVPVRKATPEDWPAEYLDMIVAMRVVSGFEEAVAHIQEHGSNHTEAIVSSNFAVCEQFKTVVHSSTVVVNASTRFADGGELGLGAEIGISTTKLHAYGPMGAEGLTALKFVVQGDGQVRT